MTGTNNLRGVVAMLLAVGLFSLMDGGLKHLSAYYPPMQVAAIRGLSALPLVIAWVLWTGAAGTLWRIRWPLHLLRGPTCSPSSGTDSAVISSGAMKNSA